MRAWEAGEIIDGRYQVKQIHDDGGMGLVYRVHHLEWNTDLAVKAPRPEHFQTEKDRARFVAEEIPDGEDRTRGGGTCGSWLSAA